MSDPKRTGTAAKQAVEVKNRNFLLEANVFDNLGMHNKTLLQHAIFYMSFQEVFWKEIFSEFVSQSYWLVVMVTGKKLFAG